MFCKFFAEFKILEKLLKTLGRSKFFSPRVEEWK